MTQQYVTKDSGERAAYGSGMVRDTQAGKARFDLVRPKGVPYEDQFMTRVALLMTRGADKYGIRNWELAGGPDDPNPQEALERFEGSADRHLQQYLAGETDEDHAAAVVFNLLAAETVRWKIEHREAARETADILADLKAMAAIEEGEQELSRREAGWPEGSKVTVQYAPGPQSPWGARMWTEYADGTETIGDLKYTALQQLGFGPSEYFDLCVPGYAFDPEEPLKADQVLADVIEPGGRLLLVPVPAHPASER